MELLEKIIDRTLSKHWFNHKGVCECGYFTTENPEDKRQHLMWELLGSLAAAGLRF